MKRRTGFLKPEVRYVTLTTLNEFNVQRFYKYKGGCLARVSASSAERAKVTRMLMFQ